MAFNYQKALADGKSEDEVLQYLVKTRSPNFKLDKALADGKSKASIIEYLANKDGSKVQTAQKMSLWDMADKASSVVNKAVETYQNAPVVKQLGQAGGAILGGVTGLASGGVEAMGTPIANLISYAKTGKPETLQQRLESITKSAKKGYDWGSQVGFQGVTMAPLGLAGKAVQLPLAASQTWEGGKNLGEGQQTGNYEQMLQGGLQLGTGVMAGAGSVGNKGIFLNKSAVKGIAGTETPISDAIRSRVVEPLKSGAQQKIVEPLSGVPESTLNVLDPNRTVPKGVDALAVSPETQKGISQRYDWFLKKAEKAASDPSAETPLEFAGKTAERAAEIYGEKLNKWGVIKKQSLDTAKGKTLDIAPTQDKFLGLVKERIGADIRLKPKSQQGEMLDAALESLGVRTKKNYDVVNAPGRVSKIALDPNDQALLKGVYGILDDLNGKGSAQQIDDAVDAIQDLVYKRRANEAIPMNGKVEAIVKQIVGDLNNNLKNTVGGQYAKANAKYSYFIDTRNKLSRALGIDASKGGSLMKRVFSPTDGGTKTLFEKIKNDTGIDLVQEAVMAKTAMEVAGDTRQRMLLQSLELLRPGGMTSQNMITKGLEYIIGKAADQRKVTEKAAKGTGTTMRK